MPAYSNSQPPYTLGPGDSQQVISPSDTLSVGFRSQQVALVRVPGDPLTTFAVDLVFNQAPGTFDFEVQVSNVADVPGDYVSAASGSMAATDSGAGNFSAHFSANAENAKWVSIYIKTAPANGGTTCTATIKR
jgi:hypothetical protein